MNREQAREIAVKAYQWGSVQDVADALHAAYEAERVAVPSDARLASIKETARWIFAAGNAVLVNSAFDQAEHFEETFERRYGEKP